MPDTTTESPNSQTSNPQLTHAEARAHLGVVTNMLQQMIPKAPPEAPQTPETAPQEEQTQEPKEDTGTAIKDLETKFMGELDTIKDLIERNAPKDKNQELEDLKKQINDVLNESDVDEKE